MLPKAAIKQLVYFEVFVKPEKQETPICKHSVSEEIFPEGRYPSVQGAIAPLKATKKRGKKVNFKLFYFFVHFIFNIRFYLRLYDNDTKIFDEDLVKNCLLLFRSSSRTIYNHTAIHRIRNRYLCVRMRLMAFKQTKTQTNKLVSIRDIKVKDSLF